MQPSERSTDSLQGLHVRPNQTSRETTPLQGTAVSFYTETPSANETPRKPPANLDASPKNGLEECSRILELRDVNPGEDESPSKAASSCAAEHRPDPIRDPNSKGGHQPSDGPATRPLKAPPSQLKKRADAEPPVLKGFRIAEDSALGREAAVSFYRSSSSEAKEPSRSSSSGDPSSSASAPPSRPPPQTAPNAGDDIDSTVLKGFRLPDGGPSSPPTRDTAVSFDGPRSSGGESPHRNPLRPVTEDTPASSEIGLSIVLSPNGPANRAVRSSFTSPKIPNPGNGNAAGRSIISRGEGHGGLPRGRLTWSDVINGAPGEGDVGGAGEGLSGADSAVIREEVRERGADDISEEGPDDVSEGGPDDVSEGGGELEGQAGEVCKRVVVERGDVSKGLEAGSGDDDDVSKMELTSLRTSRGAGRLIADGGPVAESAFGGVAGKELTDGQDDRGRRKGEKEAEENVRHRPALAHRLLTEEGRSGVDGSHRNGTGEGQLTLECGNGTSPNRTDWRGNGMETDEGGNERKGLEWHGREGPEFPQEVDTGTEFRSLDGKAPESRWEEAKGAEFRRRKQTEWADSHSDVNEPAISAARAFSPKQKAPALGSPFQDEGVHDERRLSKAPSFARLPSFSDREGSEIVSAAKAFSPAGGGKTRLGAGGGPEAVKSRDVKESEGNGEEKKEKIVLNGPDAKSFVKDAAITRLGGPGAARANRSSPGVASSLGVTSAEGIDDVRRRTKGRNAAHGEEQGDGETDADKSETWSGAAESKRCALEKDKKEARESEGRSSRKRLDTSEPAKKAVVASPDGGLSPKSSARKAVSTDKRERLAPAASEPGQEFQPTPRPRKAAASENKGPGPDNREMQPGNGLTLLAAEYEDSPPPRVASDPKLSKAPQRQKEKTPGSNGYTAGEDAREERGREVGPANGSPETVPLQAGTQPPPKRSQAKVRGQESGRVRGEELGPAGNFAQTNAPSLGHPNRLKSQIQEAAPGSPPKTGESTKIPQKQAPKRLNLTNPPPATLAPGSVEQTVQQNHPPTSEQPKSPAQSQGAGTQSRLNASGEIGGLVEFMNLNPIKTKRPVPNAQQPANHNPTLVGSPPPSSPLSAGKPHGSDAFRVQTAAANGPNRLETPEPSVSPRIAAAAQPKPQTAPIRTVPRGSHVAPDGRSGSDTCPVLETPSRGVPRGSHVTSDRLQTPQTPQAPESPPADPYLLSEPYKPSTYGEPARPSSGGRPLTSERPPSAETAGRYTYSERPVSAERWVAPSESETPKVLRNSGDNPLGNPARSFLGDSSHAFPYPFFGAPPGVQHVAGSQWPLMLGPDGQFARPFGSEGLGAVTPLQPSGLTPFLNPHQAQHLQQHPRFSFPFTGSGYANPPSKPENTPAATLGYQPSLPSTAAHSQELPNPLSQTQTPFGLNPFAQLQSAANPFGSFPNPGLQYPPFPHPYFPYGFPPQFYPQPATTFPFGSASGPLDQFQQAVSSQGGPVASGLLPPQELRPASAEGLKRSGSARSELLRAREIAVQRAQLRASRKEAPVNSANASIPAQHAVPEPSRNNLPSSNPNPPKTPSMGPLRDVRSSGEGFTTPAASKPFFTPSVPPPEPLSRRDGSPPIGSQKALPPERSGGAATSAGSQEVAPPLVATSAEPQASVHSRLNRSLKPHTASLATPLPNPSVNPHPGPPAHPLSNPSATLPSNPPLNPLLNPQAAPNAAFLHAQTNPSQTAGEALPSYDDFLEFLRFRSALAAQAPGALTSASALAAAFPGPTSHPAPPTEFHQPALPSGVMLTSATRHAHQPAVPALPTNASAGEALRTEMLTSATSRERGAVRRRQLDSAARTIQTLWREHRLRWRERRRREGPQRQAGMLLTWHFRARFLRLRRAVVSLQALRRGCAERRRFCAKIRAVRTIQAAWKLFRASLSVWQRGKLRELRDFHRHVAENLEVVGLEAPSFRTFARLMERLVAATEGARVRRRLRARKTKALVNEMKDVRDLLRQLEAEKARGGGTPDRELEKVLRVQLRQKHVLLERVARTPLLSSSPSAVNTPLPSPHPSSSGFGRSQEAFGRDHGGFGRDQGGFRRDQGGFRRDQGGLGRDPGGLGRGQDGHGAFRKDHAVLNGIRAWAAESVQGRPEDRRQLSSKQKGRGPRTTFEENEALAATYSGSAQPGYGAFLHQGERVRSASPAEGHRLSFRGASVGFGSMPPAASERRPVDRTVNRRPIVRDESAGGSFEQFAGPVFRTFDEGLSLSPVGVNSPPVKSRVASVGKSEVGWRQQRQGGMLEAQGKHQRESVRSEQTGFEEGAIEFEDVMYDPDSDSGPDVVGDNRSPVNANRPGPSGQHRGAYNEGRVDSGLDHRLASNGTRAVITQGDGLSPNPQGSGLPGRPPHRVSYDDIPITVTTSPRNHPGLHVDVPGRSNPPSQNPSPSEYSGTGPAKRPFLRARSGRLGTSFTIPDHLKLSINEMPGGATTDAPGVGAGPSLNSSELGPSTAPGSLGRSLFAEGHRVRRRVKRNPLEGEISILERDEEEEESQEPPKRAFLQRKSKAMPMQKLDWSKVKPLVEARLDPDKFATTSRAGPSRKDDPPPLPDYKNVKSRLLAYREPNKRYPPVEEEPCFEPGDQAPLRRLPTSPRGKPRRSATRYRKRSASQESSDGVKTSGHVSAHDRPERVTRNGRGRFDGAPKEAWGAGSETDSEVRSLGSQNRKRAHKTESRKKRKGEKRGRPAESGRGAPGRGRQEGSEGEPREAGDECEVQGRLSSAGELLERMYRKLQNDGGLDFSSLFPRRRGGGSVVPRLRDDADVFDDQVLYKQLTRGGRFDRLESGRLTFVADSGHSRAR